MTKQEPPLVSVIVPAYNAEATLPETLEALVAEGYEAKEIIVVNDGSRDATLTVARSFAARYSQVRCIDQPNGGVCRARNHGIAEANGKYILPVDADDILLPGFIAWAVDELEAHPQVKVAVPKAEFFGAKSGPWALPPFSLRMLARRNMIPATALFHRADWQRIGGYNEELQAREDWEFWIHLLKDGGDVATSPELGLCYRIMPHSKRENDRKLKRQIIDKLNQHYPEFFQRMLGGPLHYQRSLSPLLNLLYRVSHPRRIHIENAYAECRTFVEALPQIFRSNRGSVIYKRRNELRVLESEGHLFVVKSFAIPNLLNRLVYGTLRRSKAQRSFEYAQMLMSKGIESPRPVAWMSERSGLLFGRSYFVSEKSACPYTYNDIIRGALPAADEERYLRLIAQMVARLHNGGMVHQDLSRGNILFGDGDRVELIDLNRLRFHSVDIDEGCSNFAERLPASEHQRRLMAQAYAQARGFDADECYRLMCKYNKETT